MLISTIRQCQCTICCQEKDHPDKKFHHMINLIVSQLDEQQRRWFVAVEAYQYGRGGVSMLSRITGMDEKTIHRGQMELENELLDRPQGRIRLAGGGRPVLQQKD